MPKNAFMFLCGVETEAECLQRQLVGASQLNAIWPMQVMPGDDIYLFNFSTGLVRGPYVAMSRADCHEPAAWGGKFPVQVRVSKTTLTRQAYNHAPNTPSILRKKRPSGDLGEAGGEILSWLQESGSPMD